MDYQNELEKSVTFSAPCRVDMGGTLDISTFYVPLHRFEPSTFNIALDIRTRVTVSKFDKGLVKISSRGFETVTFETDKAPFTHPMGMMFAIATHFGANGVHIDIESSSPPKSGLGGSSVAGVAITAALMRLRNPERLIDDEFRKEAAIIAHNIENSTLGVPCGTQDQLAAAFGGINSWNFNIKDLFTQRKIFNSDKAKEFSKNIAIAYCGEPHESVDINGRWVKEFLNGNERGSWIKIAQLANSFTEAVKQYDIKNAVDLMKEEVDLRISMTPDVFDQTGQKLLSKSLENNCAARFTGAGGGGCIWALGEEKDIKNVKESWQRIIEKKKNAKLLEAVIDTEGIVEET
ncbi:MAG: galactokinase [Desulfobacterales bacterium]|nr:galactokinase [Desulfobacterales bacterium]